MKRDWGASIWIVLGLIAAGCGSGDGPVSAPVTVDSTTAPTTTSPPATTSPTTSASTSTTSSTSTTQPMFPPSTSPLVEFAGSCVERPAVREAPAFDEARLDSFGPLGVAPAIEFAVPDGPPLPDGYVPQTTVTATRIPGGMLVNVSAGGANAEHVLTAIDLDGSVRWQRCFAGGIGNVIAAAATAGPTEALLYDDSSYDGSTTIMATTVISLADGRDVRPLVDVIAAGDVPARSEALAVVADGPGGLGRRLALLTASGARAPGSTDPVAVLDLVDMTVSTVPFPPEPEFAVSYPGFVSIDAQDRLVRIDSPTSGPSRTTAVFIDGDWVTDERVLAEVNPVTVSAWVSAETPVQGFRPLTALDADGSVLWERDDLLVPDGEGFWFGVVDDVLLAATCARHTITDSGNAQCDQFRTGTYEVATGTAIWERDGYHASAISGDGFVLAPEENGGWEMLDLDTGQRAQDDQVWTEPFAFSTECCGGDTTQRAERHGGIVLTVSDGMVRIYLPQWASHPTVSLELI
jgi:hypothetical protein